MITAFNEYICQFCHVPCTRGTRDIKKPFKTWHKCLECKSWFLINGKGRVFYIQLIHHVENGVYGLMIDFEKKQTHLNYAGESEMWNTKIIFKVDEIIQTTPQEFPNRIKTWILFS